MALEARRKASGSDEIRKMIEFRKEADRDEATRLERARLQGLNEGREEGRAEGREEGRAALMEAARRLRGTRMAPEEVSRITGLRLDELG